MKYDRKCVASETISAGRMVLLVGTKKVYAGRLFKPWTWFKYETIDVVSPTKKPK